MDNHPLSQNSFQSLFDHNLDAVCSLDLEGNLVNMNPATETITGYTLDQLKRIDLTQLLVTNEHRLYGKKLFTSALRGERQHYEVQIMHRDSHVIDLGLTSIPIVINEQITGVFMIGRDITDRKRSEELLLRSEKLSVVGRLAAGVAHEIRNPLTSLKGFLQLLNSRINDYEEYFEIMLNELERINFIVSEFLVIAKPQAVNFVRKDVAIILLNTIALLNTQAIINNVQIVSEFYSDIPLIECDENQLKQVFINVLNNSIESMPKGGEIRIEVKNMSNKEVLIRCIDQGCGIPEDRIPRLGEPFYTTKEKGTGLGLMVSFRIIENHRGKINISSTMNQGTVVDIRLPI